MASVEPKPEGWSARYGAVFADPDVVDVYHLRPPYPAETLDLLVELASGGAVVELGCGLGELSRRLAPRVGRVDAVDVSVPMVERGRTLPGGDAKNLRWLTGRVEDVELPGPYALAVAADSIHWFDWEVLPAQLAAMLAPDGMLAIVQRTWLRDQRALLGPIYRRHSWNDDYAPLDPVTELERRQLFTRVDSRESAPHPWRPTLDELVAAHFSASGLARSRIADPDGFEAELRTALAAELEPREGRYDLEVVGSVVWGRPG